MLTVSSFYAYDNQHFLLYDPPYKPFYFVTTVWKDQIGYCDSSLPYLITLPPYLLPAFAWLRSFI